MKKKYFFKSTLRNNNLLKISSLLLLILSATYQHLNAQNTAFPFDALATNFNVTLNVITNTGRPFNNKLLGTNIDINSLSKAGVDGELDATRNRTNRILQGFNSVKGAQFMETFDPVSLRWPQGAFANLYHWETVVVDGVTYPTDTRIPLDVKYSLSPISTGGTDLRLGYPGLVNIHNKPVSQNGGFDILTVLNINNDDEISSGRRIDAMRADGFDVKDIELGNEFFWGNQRSNTISDENKYVARAKLVVAEAKRRAALAGITDMKFSIPISPQRGLPGQTTDHTNYNTILTADKSYYDAISVHKYLTLTGDTNGYPSDAGNRQALLSRLYMNSAAVDDCQKLYGKNADGVTFKKIWLTEWAVGITANGSKDWTASFLSTADSYLYMIENDDKYERVNWFQVFNANPFYNFSNLSGFNITGIGTVYEIMRNTFKNTSIYNVVIDSPELKLAGVDQGAKAVSARLVKTADGKLRVVAVNMTNQPANFEIKFDGTTTYNDTYTQTGIKFADLSKTFSDLTEINTTGLGVVSLPPYSINLLSNIAVPSGVILTNALANKKFETSVNDSVKVFPNPSNNGLFTISKETSWKVYNLSGQKVLEGNGDKIDLSEFNEGIYVLKTKESTQKIIYK